MRFSVRTIAVRHGHGRQQHIRVGDTVEALVHYAPGGSVEVIGRVQRFNVIEDEEVAVTLSLIKPPQGLDTIATVVIGPNSSERISPYPKPTKETK